MPSGAGLHRGSNPPADAMEERSAAPSSHQVSSADAPRRRSTASARRYRSMSRSRICSTRKAGLRRPLRTAIWATAPRLLAGSSQTVLVANSAAARAWSPAGSRAGSRSLRLAVTMAPAPSATRRRRALRRGPGGGRCLRGPPSPRSRRRRRPGVAVRGDAPSASGPPRRRCLAARASPSRDTRAPRGSPRSRLGDRGPRPRARGGRLAAGSARGRCFGEAPWTPAHLCRPPGRVFAPRRCAELHAGRPGQPRCPLRRRY